MRTRPGVILDFGCDTLNPKDHTQLVLAFGAPDVFPGQDVEQPWLNLEVTIVSVHGADESPEVIATHPDTANSKRHILRRHPSGLALARYSRLLPPAREAAALPAAEP